MYLVSLYFDEKTNKILRRYIQKVAEETGNAFMTEHEVPPHLTIMEMEDVLEGCEGLLEYFKENHRII